MEDPVTVVNVNVVNVIILYIIKNLKSVQIQILAYKNVFHLEIVECEHPLVPKPSNDSEIKDVIVSVLSGACSPDCYLSNS